MLESLENKGQSGRAKNKLPDKNTSFARRGGYETAKLRLKRKMPEGTERDAYRTGAAYVWQFGIFLGNPNGGWESHPEFRNLNKQEQKAVEHDADWWQK